MKVSVSEVSCNVMCHLAISRVVCLGALELEGRALVDRGGVVLAAGHDAERSAGLSTKTCYQ